MSDNDFHIHLYGRSPGDLPPQGQRTNPIPTSFEEAQQRLLERMPEMLFEPDGSFAWASVKHQLVGMIYDAGGQIQYVELRGHCAPQQLRDLIETLAGSPQIDEFAVMVLPNRQWKIFHTFEKSVPSEDSTSANNPSH